MRFPLNTRIVNLTAEGHVKAGRGVATDYQASYVDLFAPCDGRVETYSGTEGGNWLRLIRDNGDKLEFAHLSEYLVKAGYVKEGNKIAVTGNTGQITSGPHLHIQIFVDGNRVDPEKYFNHMTQEEVKKLYTLAFYRLPDSGELAFWTNKSLSEFLKTAINDRAKFLLEQGV